MHTFKDNEGVEWTVKANTLSLGRVEDALGVSFCDPKEDDGPFVRIACNAMFCFRVLFVLCEAQAKERGITDEQFSERLVGDTLGRAQAVLLDAIVEFFPTEQRRKAARQVVESLRAVEAATIEHTSAKLAGIDLDKVVREAVDAMTEGTDDGR